MDKTTLNYTFLLPMVIMRFIQNVHARDNKEQLNVKIYKWECEMFELNLKMNNLRKLMRIMHDCLYARSHEDVLKFIDLLNDTIPFNAAILCRGNIKSGVMRFDESVNHSYPAEWVQHYFKNELFLLDPVAITSANITKPFTWEVAFRDIDMTSDSKEFVGLAEDYGLNEGVTCTCNDSQVGNISTLISLETNGYKIGEEYIAIVEYILPHIHQAVVRIDKATQLPKDHPNFTPREIEILKWAYEGKTSWEIGITLSISERTVKFHLANIYRKFNVKNRSHAVAKAIHYRVL